MKSRIALSLSIGVLCLAAGCSNQTKSTMNTPVANNSTVAPSQVRTDSDILGTLLVLNRTEIAAAKDAKRRATQPQVKNFANYMLREHQNNFQETRNLGRRLNIKPNRQNEVAAMIRKSSSQQLSQFNRVNRSAFDRTYIAAMVKDHTEALGVVDLFYNQTTNGQLRNQLKLTRAHIEAHLQMAKTIQNEIH